MRKKVTVLFEQNSFRSAVGVLFWRSVPRQEKIVAIQSSYWMYRLMS